MLFGSRNSLLFLFFIISICLAALFVISLVFVLIFSGGNGYINYFESHPFWFTYDITLYGTIPSMISIGLLLVAGFFFATLFRVFFKKIGQPEIFFFALFFFSLFLETLRLSTICFELLKLPPFFLIVLSRIVYAGRVFGLMSLFFASLYALDFQYQKFEIVVAVMLLFAFFLSFSVPFDSQLLLTDGLFKLSDEQGMFIIYFSLTVFLVLDCIIAMIRGRTILILIGVVLLLAGREFLFFSLSPLLLVVGSGCLIGGFLLTYKGFETHYNVV